MLRDDFYRYLASFEEVTVSPDQLENFVGLLRLNSVFDSLFENYVNQRLRKHIPDESLLNLVRNLELSKETRYLSELLNKQLTAAIVFRHECFRQFYYLHQNDFRHDRHILKSFARRLSELRFNDAMDIIKEVSPNLNVDRHTLILFILESLSTTKHGLARIIDYMGKLSAPDRYSVAIKTIENGSDKVFLSIENQFGKAEIYDLITANIKENKDQDNLAIALRRSTLPITHLQGCFYLNLILSHNADYIPYTLERLYYKAKSEKCWSYLLVLGIHKNKKELLRDIVESKDSKLVDDFFLLYNNFPEVRHLTPFL